MCDVSVSVHAHGTLSGSGASQTYTPAPDFNGTDTFTFRVSDGTLTSNLGTMTITVLEGNDAPSAAADAYNTLEDTPLQFTAAELTANDTAGPADETTQTLTVSSATATADTNGTVSFNGGVITYTPSPNFHGAASFTYQVCDNGITGGLSSPLCSAGTVHVNVASVNDAPVITSVTGPTAQVQPAPPPQSPSPSPTMTPPIPTPPPSPGATAPRPRLPAPPTAAPAR